MRVNKKFGNKITKAGGKTEKTFLGSRTAQGGINSPQLIYRLNKVLIKFLAGFLQEIHKPVPKFL